MAAVRRRDGGDLWSAEPQADERAEFAEQLLEATADDTTWEDAPKRFWRQDETTHIVASDEKLVPVETYSVRPAGLRGWPGQQETLERYQVVVHPSADYPVLVTGASPSPRLPSGWVAGTFPANPFSLGGSRGPLTQCF